MRKRARGHNGSRMDSHGFGKGPTEKAFAQGPEFDPTPLLIG